MRNFAYAQVLGSGECEGRSAFSGESCADVKLDVSSENENDKERIMADSVNKALKQLGASEKCKKSFDADYKSTRAYAQYKKQSSSGGFMGIGSSQKASGEKYENEMQQANQRMRQEGCGNLYADITNITNLNRRLACNLNKSVDCKMAKVDNNASVKIKVRKMEGDPSWDRFVAKTQEEIANIGISTSETAIALKDTPALAASIIESNERIRQTLIDSITHKTVIKNSKFSAKAGISVKQIRNISNDIKDEMTETLKEIATKTAEHKLSQQTGLGSLDPNTKHAITKKVNNKAESLKKHIQTSFDEAKVDLSNSSNVEINVPRSLEMDNVVLEANSQVNLIQQSISKNASNLGIMIATDLIKESKTKTETQQTSEGINLSELSNALGEANRIAEQRRPVFMPSLNSSGSKSNKSNSTIIIIVIAVVVVLAIIMMSGSEPPPEYPGYY